MATATAAATGKGDTRGTSDDDNGEDDDGGGVGSSGGDGDSGSDSGASEDGDNEEDTRHRYGFGVGGASTKTKNRAKNSNSNKASSDTDEHLLLATGGDDGVVRVWCISAHGGDDSSWFDAEDGVTAAIGPGVAGTITALPAATFVAGTTPTSVTLYGAGPGTKAALALQYAMLTDPVAAAAAAAKVEAWQAEYEDVEAIVEALCSERIEHVRQNFANLSSR
jgi:hypothetical protein